ncbi:hypothetical protein [Caldimonas brevitalea]|uniref:Uncharacterized protein n=1 Tax=Caldimonas brevitalea TaxID=413882 RepID=A0A0G3BLG0_9BURK|nr:hypothetical protein [Caldimonas brevitalea]AKJ28798.1 hypothetical protein AAW51_2107 [Caldimonas brevitalea]
MGDIDYTVRRTWAERLFSLPWRPWVSTKQVRDTAAERDRRWRELLKNSRLGLVDAAPAPAKRSRSGRESAAPAATNSRESTITGLEVDYLTIAAIEACFHRPSEERPAFESGGGGSYAGGGASGSWSDDSPSCPASNYSSTSSTPECSSSSDSGSSSWSD